jgi:hypothetical protein
MIVPPVAAIHWLLQAPPPPFASASAAATVKKGGWISLTLRVCTPALTRYPISFKGSKAGDSMGYRPTVMMGSVPDERDLKLVTVPNLLIRAPSI